MQLLGEVLAVGAQRGLELERGGDRLRAAGEADHPGAQVRGEHREHRAQGAGDSGEEHPGTALHPAA